MLFCALFTQFKHDLHYAVNLSYAFRAPFYSLPFGDIMSAYSMESQRRVFPAPTLQEVGLVGESIPRPFDQPHQIRVTLAVASAVERQLVDDAVNFLV